MFTFKEVNQSESVFKVYPKECIVTFSLYLLDEPLFIVALILSLTIKTGITIFFFTFLSSGSDYLAGKMEVSGSFNLYQQEAGDYNLAG